MTNYRWKVMWMLFVIQALNYLDRANLSVAGPQLLKAFHINDVALGVMLSAFSWSYAFMQMPGGVLVDVVGPKVLYIIAMVWWAVASFFTTLAGSIGTLVGIRIALGVGEAPGISANARLATDWFPVQERGLASSIFIGGIPISSIVGPPLLAIFVTSLGWQAAFWATGALTLIWAIIWAVWYRDPQHNPKVSKEELAHIRQGQLVVNVQEKVSWGRLLKDRNVMGMTLGEFFIGYVLFMFLTWLPGYLVQARHFTLIRSGFYTAIPWIFGLVGVYLGGWISDRMVRSGTKTLVARKTLLVVGMLLAMAVMVAAWVGSAGLAIALISVSVFGLMMADSVSLSACEDISPAGKGGSVAGILFFGGNIGGGIAPIVTGVLATTTHSFVVPLTVGGIMALASAASFGFMLKDSKETELEITAGVGA